MKHWLIQQLTGPLLYFLQLANSQNYSLCVTLESSVLNKRKFVFSCVWEVNKCGYFHSSTDDV